MVVIYFDDARKIQYQFHHLVDLTEATVVVIFLMG